MVTVRLEELGHRVCVMGPSGSGKSTLAAAIGRRQHLPVVHLDQYRFDTDQGWVMRSDLEFGALHDAVITGERWVLDGNYSRWLPQRLDRATGLILLDASTAASLARYLWRALGRGGRRVGGLAEGLRDAPSWAMVRHILGPARDNRRRYRSLFGRLDLPKIALRDRAALQHFYREHDLRRPA